MTEKLIPIQKKRQRAIDERDTFDYSTPNLDVIAKATDPYVQPMEAKTNQLLQALNIVNNSVPVLTETINTSNKINYTKGYEARTNGEALDTDKAGAYIRGWEELDGELKVADYQLETQKYFDENKYLDPASFNAGLQEISAKYTSGASGNFLRGFAVKAAGVEKATALAYQQEQSKAYREQTFAKASSVFRNTMNEQIRSLLGYSPDEMLNDPVKYQKFYQGKDVFKNAMSPFIRKYLTEQMSRFKDLQLTTQEVSALMLGVVGDIATTYGMPELLSYTSLKDNGIAVIDNSELMESVNKLTQTATNRRDQIMENQDKDTKKVAFQKFSDSSLGYFGRMAALKVTDPNYNQKYSAILNEMLKDPTIMKPPYEMNSEAKSLIDAARDGANYQVPSQIVDAQLMNPIYNKLTSGTLTKDDIHRVISKVTPDSKDRLVSFYNMIDADERRNANANGSRGQFKLPAIDAKKISGLQKVVTDSWRNAGKDLNQMDYATINNYIFDRYIQIKEAQGNLTLKDWDALNAEVAQLIDIGETGRNKAEVGKAVNTLRKKHQTGAAVETDDSEESPPPSAPPTNKPKPTPVTTPTTKAKPGAVNTPPTPVVKPMASSTTKPVAKPAPNKGVLTDAQQAGVDAYAKSKGYKPTNYWHNGYKVYLNASGQPVVVRPPKKKGKKKTDK